MRALTSTLPILSASLSAVGATWSDIHDLREEADSTAISFQRPDLVHPIAIVNALMFMALKTCTGTTISDKTRHQTNLANACDASMILITEPPSTAEPDTATERVYRYCANRHVFSLEPEAYPRTSTDYFNLWSGIVANGDCTRLLETTQTAVHGEDASLVNCTRILEHIFKVICSGDVTLNKYLLDYSVPRAHAPTSRRVSHKMREVLLSASSFDSDIGWAAVNALITGAQRTMTHLCENGPLGFDMSKVGCCLSRLDAWGAPNSGEYLFFKPTPDPTIGMQLVFQLSSGNRFAAIVVHSGVPADSLPSHLKLANLWRQAPVPTWTYKDSQCAITYALYTSETLRTPQLFVLVAHYHPNFFLSVAPFRVPDASAANVHFSESFERPQNSKYTLPPDLPEHCRLALSAVDMGLEYDFAPDVNLVELRRDLQSPNNKANPNPWRQFQLLKHTHPTPLHHCQKCQIRATTKLRR